MHKLSQQNFAYAPTAVLLVHMQNFVVIQIMMFELWCI